MSSNLPRDLCAGAGPWGVDPDFSDESFSSIINFIPLVERVPELAVAEASFIFVASRRGPPPQGAILGASDDAHTPRRAHERQSLAEARAVAHAHPGGGS